MSTVPQIIKRNAYAFAAGLFLLAATVPSIVVPRLASAAQITERSIKMSSSAASASSQTYQIQFDTATTSAIEGVVVDFCSDTPILSASCSFPSGMTVGSTYGSQTGLDGTHGTWSASLINSNHSVLVENTAASDSITSGTTVTVTVSGFTNPSSVGTFYARIVTYVDADVADDYVSATPGTHIDDGGVALSTTATVNVSATVQETLTFCVSGTVPGAGCSAPSAPSITLGDTGPPVVLDTNDVYSDDINFQLSTNAANGAIVRMKGASANLTSGSNTIPAVGSGVSATPVTISAGTAAFGMRLADADGVLADAAYDATGNDFNMVAADITSTYGDEIASVSAPVSNADVPVYFGATASATTPAGVYTAAFSLIATSTY